MKTIQGITFYEGQQPAPRKIALVWRAFDWAVLALFLYSGWCAGQVLFG